MVPASGEGGSIIPRLVPAVLVFWLAFDGGTYSLESRNSAGIAVWWALIVTLGLGLLPLANPSREAFLAGGFLAALAGLTLLSMLWADSPERAFAEFNRVALYLGIFVLVVVASTRSQVAAWVDGIAIGIAAVAVLALASRLFPGVFPEGDLPRFLPTAQTRLSYPLNYWNGLAIFSALGFPLLLRSAVSATTLWRRALAVAPLPVIAAVMYLASSRGGFAAAIFGSVVFVGLAARRWAAAGALAAGVLGSVAAIAVLVPRTELVNGPLSSDAAASQGRAAAALLLAACVLCAGGYAVAVRYVSRVRAPGPFVGRLATASVLVAALIGVAASNPVERFDTFRQPPQGLAGEDDFVKAHLLSGNGSGRWQFWSSALDQFQENPLRGIGAGSYEAWWAQNGTISAFVRDAHSLYLETLGELGLLGLLLLLGAFAMGGVALAERIFRTRAEDRVTLAAVAGGFGAYALVAGIDWMWELTAVSAVGIALLALLTGPATAVVHRPRLRAAELSSPPPSSRSRQRLVLGLGLLVAGWLFVCAAAIPLFAQLKIRDSQVSVGRGDAGAALSDAHAARKLQPWAASPYLQLALVQEQTGELEDARSSIGQAIDRDPKDWRLWLVAARIETKAEDIVAARRSLARAAELNPRSPLFTSIRNP